MRIWRKNTERNALYAAGARDYERHAGRSIYNARYERPAMLRAIGDVSGLNVIDAGCAGGYYAASLARDAASVVALDASPEMIALVREKNLANVDARVHDLATPLSWIADESIDLVMSSLALHYLADWDVPLGEFRRVLRPRGRLVVSVHHPAMTAPGVDDYFETQAMNETWEVEGAEHEVSFFHRSLEETLNALIRAGFVLSSVMEPHLERQPDASQTEQKLATRPWFLIIEARKP